MTDRFIGPAGGKRRQRFWMLSSLVAVLALAFAVNSYGGPVGQAGGFEDDDGNLTPGDVMVPGQPSPNFDWNSFDPVTWSPHPATTPTRQTDDKTVNGFQFKGIEDYPNPGASGHHRRYLVRRRDQAGRQLRGGGHRQAAEQG